MGWRRSYIAVEGTIQVGGERPRTAVNFDANVGGLRRHLTPSSPRGNGGRRGLRLALTADYTTQRFAGEAFKSEFQCGCRETHAEPGTQFQRYRSL